MGGLIGGGEERRERKKDERDKRREEREDRGMSFTCHLNVVSILNIQFNNLILFDPFNDLSQEMS